MPEGPEVRRYADALHDTLAGRPIEVLSARTKAAKAWLAAYPDAFPGRVVERVRSHGKNLVGYVEGGLYFYAHLMMWGRWQVAAADPAQPPDRRERARIVAAGGEAAILLSAPVFEVGEGDPYAAIPYLASLGPDILPYPGEEPFAASCFLERLTAPTNRCREIGAALLDQTVAAGIGNYLRAEILFVCRLSPFRRVSDLLPEELASLARVVPELAARAYADKGVTVPADVRERLKADPSLRYPNASPEWASHHYVFRRTNLPCVVCGTPIRQKRQVTYVRDDGEEKERVIYFCPECQQVTGK